MNIFVGPEKDSLLSESSCQVMYSVEAIEIFFMALQMFFSQLVGHVLVVQVLQSAVSVVGVFFEAVVFGGGGCRVGGLAFGYLIYKYSFSVSLLIPVKFLSLAIQLIDGCF